MQFDEEPAVISPLAFPTKLDTPHIVEATWEELITEDDATQVEINVTDQETQTDPTLNDLFNSGNSAIEKTGTVVSDIRSQTSG